MEIKVNVQGQKLRTETNLKTYVSGTQNFVKLIFNFTDNSWNGLTNIHAQFRQGDIAYSEELKDNSVYLPSELVAGECLVTLYTANNKDVIAISDTLRLLIKDNYIVTDPESVKMKSSFYQQLVEECTFSSLKTKTKTIIGAINELYDMIQKL